MRRRITKRVDTSTGNWWWLGEQCPECGCSVRTDGFSIECSYLGCGYHRTVLSTGERTGLGPKRRERRHDV